VFSKVNLTFCRPSARRRRRVVGRRTRSSRDEGGQSRGRRAASPARWRVLGLRALVRGNTDSQRQLGRGPLLHGARGVGVEIPRDVLDGTGPGEEVREPRVATQEPEVLAQERRADNYYPVDVRALP